MNRFKEYSAGESWEAMRARFPDAINAVMTSGDDEQCIDDRHIFDFDDGWRMHVSRDQLDEGVQVILIAFAHWQGVPYPVTLLVAKAATHFAELTDHRYGDPEVVGIDHGVVQLAYRLQPAVVATIDSEEMTELDQG